VNADWHAFTGWAFWAWQGWPALAAIGTLGLAWATWRLARRTTDLAIATQSDVAAQFRPIVAPAQFVDPERLRTIQTADVERYKRSPEWAMEPKTGGGLLVAVTNVGHGAALHVRAAVRDSSDRPHLRASALGVDCDPEVVRLRETPHRDGVTTLEVFYESANRERWVSVIEIMKETSTAWRVELADVRRGSLTDGVTDPS
jgi:hypothetical protein